MNPENMQLGEGILIGIGAEMGALFALKAICKESPGSWIDEKRLSGSMLAIRKILILGKLEPEHVKIIEQQVVQSSAAREAMTTDAPNPESTLAKIMGAQEWPEYPGWWLPQYLPPPPAIRELPLRTDRVGTSRENVRNFFDDPRSPAVILKDVKKFLVSPSGESGSTGPISSDLLFYFVGHGSFAPP